MQLFYGKDPGTSHMGYYKGKTTVMDSARPVNPRWTREIDMKTGKLILIGDLIFTTLSCQFFS
jgi:hypothetical protein